MHIDTYGRTALQSVFPNIGILIIKKMVGEIIRLILIK